MQRARASGPVLPVAAGRLDQSPRAGAILELARILVSEQGPPTEEAYWQSNQVAATLTVGKRAADAHLVPAAELRTYHQALQKCPAQVSRKAHLAQTYVRGLRLFQETTAGGKRASKKVQEVCGWSGVGAGQTGKREVMTMRFPPSSLEEALRRLECREDSRDVEASEDRHRKASDLLSTKASAHFFDHPEADSWKEEEQQRPCVL